MYHLLREYELPLLPKDIRKIQLHFERKKTLDEIKKELRSKKNKFFLAIENGEIVGFIKCKIHIAKDGYKEGEFDIFVRKNFRNKGVGKSCLRELLNILRKKVAGQF